MIFRRDRLRAKRGAAGFTLLEVLVATALMGIAVVGLLSLTSQSLANASHVKDYDRAAMLGRSKMNELLSVEPLPVGRPLEGRFSKDWKWRAAAAPFDAPGVRPASGQTLVRIALRVEWTRNGVRRSVEFEGYRRIRLPTGARTESVNPRALF